jgi:hypothetical protein
LFSDIQGIDGILGYQFFSSGKIEMKRKKRKRRKKERKEGNEGRMVGNNSFSDRRKPNGKSGSFVGGGSHGFVVSSGWGSVLPCGGACSSWIDAKATRLDCTSWDTFVSHPDAEFFMCGCVCQASRYYVDGCSGYRPTLKRNQYPLPFVVSNNMFVLFLVLGHYLYRKIILLNYYSKKESYMHGLWLPNFQRIYWILKVSRRLDSLHSI